jgi:hypothetical protein
MEMTDMVLVSVDDHICEPPDMFDRQLAGEPLATAPKFLTDKDGTNFWSYQDLSQSPRQEAGLDSPACLQRLAH